MRSLGPTGADEPSADEAKTPRTWRRPRLRRTGPVLAAELPRYWPGRGMGPTHHEVVDADGTPLTHTHR
jgi:hypothetical protein